MNNRRKTAVEIAQWMWNAIETEGRLYQFVAAAAIEAKYGDDFVYENANHNTAIEKDVLDAFRSISGRKVVWSNSGRYWRKREDNDPPFARQVNR